MSLKTFNKFSISTVVIVLFFAFFSVKTKALAVSPDGTYTYWILPSSGYTNMQFSITPFTDPSPQGWFWSHQWWIDSNDTQTRAAYTGLQTVGSGFGTKIAIFSIWDATGASNTSNPNSQCLMFGGEGTGYSCRIPYNWVVGRKYTFNVTKINQTTWETTITDLTTNTTSLIGDINVPSTWGGFIDQTVNWTEFYSGTINACSDINYARAYFAQPTFDNGTVIPLYNSSSISSSGGCNNSNISSFNNGVYQEEGIENDLTGNYYNDTTFSNLVFTQLDPAINFNWGNNSPDPRINSSNFSIKWMGEIQAPETNIFTFCSQYKDGVKLWVNNSLLINDLNRHKTVVKNCGVITLSQNQFYPIVMEYIGLNGSHSVNLTYSTSDISNQIVPSVQLRSQ